MKEKNDSKEGNPSKEASDNINIMEKLGLPNK